MRHVRTAEAVYNPRAFKAREISMQTLTVLHSHKQIASLILLTLSVALAIPAHAQTFSVLWQFNGEDGNGPGTPVLDRGGNVYGSTVGGGPLGSPYGNVYKLAHAGSGYVLDNLYTFTPHNNNGYYPVGGLTFGPDGALYGTTEGGGSTGYGVVFRMTPQATICRAVTCYWDITAIYTFQGGTDVNGPYGNVTFDSAGNMYGTGGGGQYNQGAIFKLTHSGGSWTESVIYSFQGSAGSEPNPQLVLDAVGNIYGTTSAGGAHSWGAVYELSPSGSGWTEQVLYSFTNGSDGRSPSGGVVFDSAGNLFGSAANNGQNFGGTVFELSPGSGGWAFNLLYSLSGRMGPEASLTLDSAGNIYGTTFQDGVNELGSVFELSPSNGGWIYTDLHDFAGGSDGAHPTSSVALDANGNIFGTSNFAEGFNAGTIFEITR